MGKILAKNKRALFDYKIEDTYKAGIVLTGPEVKSVKTGQINLRGSFATLDPQGELWLINAHIAPYRYSEDKNYNPQRNRKLLLTKKELNALVGKLKERGLTLVPLEVFLERNLVKIKLGIGRGKKLYDKRKAIKEREAKRKIEKIIRYKK